VSAVPEAGPEALPRRSFHWRDLVAAGARFRPLGDAMVAADYGGADEAGAARRLGLADLSPLPRTGFKGPNAAEWLAGQGVPLGEESNRAYAIGGGALAARLAPGEVLVLGALDGTTEASAALDNAWSYDVPAVWPVPRRDASFWFLVTGEFAPATFAKMCGVDLRPKSFSGGHIAQTSVARTNAIVIRDDLGETLAYHLLGDSASAAFMWAALLDAMAEFEGKPVGLDAIQGVQCGAD
jgi:sarcosine oxidase subunit gamma